MTKLTASARYASTTTRRRTAERAALALLRTQPALPLAVVLAIFRAHGLSPWRTLNRCARDGQLLVIATRMWRAC